MSDQNVKVSLIIMASAYKVFSICSLPFTSTVSIW